MDTLSKIIGVNAPPAAASKLAATACSAPRQLMGIELEIENVGTEEEARARVNPAIWSVVSDGSLRPSGVSWEYVSAPMRMEELLSELDLFFQNHHLTDDKNYSDRTSVHVHTNVLDMTPAQIATLCLVYSVTEDVLFQFVNFFKKGERESFYRDTNIYCIPWSHCRMNSEVVRKLLTDAKGVTRAWQKYTALNLLPARNAGTVEWRHMHGTNDMEKLTTWLNIIGCIMRFSKENEFDEVSGVISKLNDTSAYQQFFTRIFGGYLPYNDEYAPRMAEGVINAKYALMNKDRKKSALLDVYLPDDELPGNPARDVDMAIQQAAAQIREGRNLIPPRPVRPTRAAGVARREAVARNLAQEVAGLRGIDPFIHWPEPPRAAALQEVQQVQDETGFTAFDEEQF